MSAVKLKDCCKFYSGGTPTKGKADYWNGEIPWFSPKDIKSFELVSSQDRISKIAIRDSATRLVMPGTILVVGRSGVLAHTLPVGIVRQPSTFNQDIKAIVPSDGFDPEYVALYLTAHQSFILKEGVKRGPTVHSLITDFIEELEIPDISIDEQCQIAAHLKTQLAEVETARQAAQVQLRDADALRTAIYRDAFLSVVPVAVPPLTKDAPENWQWRKLIDIARLESGHTPSRHRPDWWGGDISWVSLTEIRALDGLWVESTQLRTNAEGIANSSARILPHGTVCYSRTASVGFVCIMAAPMATSQDFANWVCGDELDAEFLMHALICSRKELREIATGATHKTIYMPQLESFQLCAPNIDEQRRIITHLKQQLAEVDTLRTALEHQQRELDALPQRILAQAFSPQGE